MKIEQVLKLVLGSPIIVRKLTEAGETYEGASGEQLEQAALKALSEMRAEDPAEASDLVAAVEGVAAAIYGEGFKAGCAHGSAYGSP